MKIIYLVDTVDHPQYTVREVPPDEAKALIRAGVAEERLPVAVVPDDIVTRMAVD